MVHIADSDPNDDDQHSPDSSPSDATPLIIAQRIHLISVIHPMMEAQHA
jgi:hypothetical protein